MVVAKRTESHPPPFPVSSLDGPMDRQTHGQTDPWPYPPPPSITPMGCGATVGVLSPLTLWAEPPHPPPPPPQQMCSNIWHRVCARGGGERGSPHAAPSPLLSNSPQRDQKGRTRRRDPFLARPPPLPPSPRVPYNTHTCIHTPRYVCAHAGSYEAPAPLVPPSSPHPPPPQAVPPPPADSVYMTQCVSCRSYSLVYGD